SPRDDRNKFCLTMNRGNQTTPTGPRRPQGVRYAAIYDFELEDVNVVSKAIEQRASGALGGEHAGPLVEGQVAGDDNRAALVALAEDLEQQLCAGRRQRNVSQFVDH